MTASPSAITCAYLGPEGTYTEEAALAASPVASRMPLATIEAVFQAVAAGEASLGVVPIENLIQGPVTEVLDCLYEHADRVKLSGMLMLPIRHALGTSAGTVTIRAIYSKDQALKQCSRYLQGQYPDAALVETASTTAPMRDIAEGRLREAAVVGSTAALNRHGLTLLADDIGNSKANKTKFAVLTPRVSDVSAPSAADTTLCVVYPHRDRVGLLRTVVDVVSDRCGLNLSAIHSRPDAQGSFRFYLEIEGHESDPALEACFELLRSQLSGEHVDVVVVGSFPRTTFIDRNIQHIALHGALSDRHTWLESFLSHCGYKVTTGTSVPPEKGDEPAPQVVLVSDSPAAVKASIGGLLPSLSAGQLLVVDCEALCGALDLAHGAPDGVEVLGINVLPARLAADRRDRGVVFVRTARSGALADELEAMFYKQGARLISSTPDHHDRQMALHRHLACLVQVALAETAQQLFGDVGQFDRFASPVSRQLLSGLATHLQKAPSRELDSLVENTQAPAVIRAFVVAVASLGDSLAAGDSDALGAAISRAHAALARGSTTLPIPDDDA